MVAGGEEGMEEVRDRRHKEGRVSVRDTGVGGRDDCGWADRVKRVKEE